MSNDPYEEHAWELIGMDEFEEPTHLESVQLKLKDLGAEELEMVDLIVDRILMGKEYYGEWRPSEDKRDNIQGLSKRLSTDATI